MFIVFLYILSELSLYILALEMAFRTIPAYFPSLKSSCSGLSYSESVDFTKVACVSNSRRSKSLRIKRFSVTRSSNSDSVALKLPPVSANEWPYCYYSESPHKTVRRKTRTVMVGNVALGSDHPIKILTMTTSDTKNMTQTIEEVMRIADKGADLVCITVQGKREADACFDIKNTLVQKNYNIPLVADIQFAPSVALRVAECFDKICVSTGNFAGRRTQFKKGEYTVDDYDEGLGQISKVFTPLVVKCKKYGRALHIGTNHGSLSDRMTSCFGDSPRGMVESAFEFARLCQELDYHNFVFSMKASNPVIMVKANRLLVAEMYDYGWDYPLHLGVTEAGEGEDGRMKFAIGIGTLLLDGLGDTIGVSPTEPPEEEIVHCRKLANLGMQACKLQKGVVPFEEKHRWYFEFQRRTGQLGQFPLQKEGEEVDYRGVLHRDGSVLMSVSLDKLKTAELLYKSLAAKLAIGMPFKDLSTVDSILLRELPSPEDVDSRLALKRLIDASMGVLVPLSELLTKQLPNAIALVNLQELWTGAYRLLPEGTRLAVMLRGDEPYEDLNVLKEVNDIIMLLHNLPCTEDNISRVHAARRLFDYLADNTLNFPVIYHLQYPEGTNKDDLLIETGSNIGALLVDGLGDGLMLEAPDQDSDFLRNASFNLLQGCRMRNTKIEYVSCPSCSRAVFDVQKISAEIKDKTSHLRGVSIAIMGCTVHLPEEMVDVDFACIGSGAGGRIFLLEGENIANSGITMEQATDAVIQMIKDHGRWVDPSGEE